MTSYVAIICGSKATPDSFLSQLDYLIVTQELEIDVVVSGGARGADNIGEQWAISNGVDLIIMPANWKKYGKAAGYERNEKMIHHIMTAYRYEEPLVLALWDGESRGTKNIIDLAMEEGIRVEVIDV